VTVTGGGGVEDENIERLQLPAEKGKKRWVAARLEISASMHVFCSASGRAALPPSWPNMIARWDYTNAFPIQSSLVPSPHGRGNTRHMNDCLPAVSWCVMPGSRLSMGAVAIPSGGSFENEQVPVERCTRGTNPLINVERPGPRPLPPRQQPFAPLPAAAATW